MVPRAATRAAIVAAVTLAPIVCVGWMVAAIAEVTSDAAIPLDRIRALIRFGRLVVMTANRPNVN